MLPVWRGIHDDELIGLKNVILDLATFMSIYLNWIIKCSSSFNCLKTIWILLEQTPYQYELDDEEDKTFLKSIDSIYFCISVKIILPKPQLAVSWTYTPSFDIYMSKVGPKSVSSYQDSISFILVYNGERGAMIDVGMIKNAKYFRVLFNLILYPRTKGSY